jgi:hypothetical protein
MSRKAASFLAKRRREIYDKIIRVDHAGELGADRIYAGQMTILGRHQKVSLGKRDVNPGLKLISPDFICMMFISNIYSLLRLVQ